MNDKQMVVSQKEFLVENISKLMEIIPCPPNKREDRARRLVTNLLLVISYSPILQKCSNISVFKCLMDLAQLELDPTPALSECYLVPYKAKVGKDYIDEAKLIIGYRGLMALTRRSGEIKSIVARVVLEGDEFYYRFGLDEKLEHVPSTNNSKDRVVKYAYAIATLADGTKQFDIMNDIELDKIRSTSKTGFGEYSPWSNFYEEMAKKTVVRRLFKMLPVSKEMQIAASLDEHADIIANFSEVDRQKKNLNEIAFAPKNNVEPAMITTDEIPFNEEGAKNGVN